MDCFVASLLAMTLLAFAPTTTVIARLDRAIQYAAASPNFSASLEYWITRLRG
jgi:hypothetical protein